MNMIGYPTLQSQYNYSTRWTNPYPDPRIDQRPVGFAGVYGMGAYPLGGGYGSYNNWMTGPSEPCTAGAACQIGYPYFDTVRVNQMSPSWWSAQRQTMPAAMDVHIPLQDNRPFYF